MKIWKYLTKVAILATIYFLFGTINNFISINTELNSINIFIPEGIALASVILYGRNMWLGIFIGEPHPPKSKIMEEACRLQLLVKS